MTPPAARLRGLLISIPIVVWGSTLILKWVEKYPWIVQIGVAVLCWTVYSLLLRAWPSALDATERLPVLYGAPGPADAPLAVHAADGVDAHAQGTPRGGDLRRHRVAEDDRAGRQPGGELLRDRLHAERRHRHVAGQGERGGAEQQSESLDHGDTPRRVGWLETEGG